jgi:hypothetical protein
MLIRVLLTCLPLLMFTRCSKSARIEHKQNIPARAEYTLSAIDTINIRIDSLTNNFNPTYQFSELGTLKILSVYNPRVHRIEIYDTHEQNLLSLIRLNTEGPDGIPELSGLYIHTLDSIFLFTLEMNFIFLIDSSGSIIDRVDLNPSLSTDGIQYEMLVEEYFDVSYTPELGILTFWAAPFIDRETSKFYQYPVVFDFDINENKILKNYGYYPESYRKRNVYFLNHRLIRSVTESYEIHGFEASHELFVYDKVTKELLKEVYSKSKYLPDQIESSTSSGRAQLTLQEQVNHNIKTGRYKKLIYDKTNDLLYRFVRHPQELKGADGLLNSKIGSTLSIMILDQELGVAGEVLLPANVFVDHFSFVSGGVLWVNANHPSNPQNTESYFQFVIFSPTKL